MINKYRPRTNYTEHQKKVLEDFYRNNTKKLVVLLCFYKILISFYNYIVLDESPNNGQANTLFGKKPRR